MNAITNPSQVPVATTCPYCGVGCGIVAEPTADGAAAIRGDEHHPANRGQLCAKGLTLGETLGQQGRLLYPEVGGQRVSWESALDTVAAGFAQVLDDHGPEAVAFYVSGQLLTEDYYVVNKLMKGYLGSANVDTNSRLCMASSVAGHKRAFGSDTVPGVYQDLELADVVVLVGSNLAWCHPVLYQRLAAAKRQRKGLQVVVVDPRTTATCDLADLHLPLAPGSDAALFNGLLLHLHRQGLQDLGFLDDHTEGLAACLAAAHQDVPTVADVARRCALDPAQVMDFYRRVAGHDRTVTVYSQGINQSSSGSDKVNAIINSHLLTGRIGKPGAGPFSVTGQPNAMGGREVGGLANQLAAHMDFTPEAVDRVQRFWDAPRMATAPGLKAVELFDAVAEGRIKALWIMATNPAVSLPDADAVVAGLARCPLVVVSDVVDHTDTLRRATVKLPALGWGEKDGTVTNSERCISRQRAFLPPPGEARADWWAVTQVARRLGFGGGFPYETPAMIFKEHAALSAFENHGRRDFDIGGLAELDDAAYHALAPVPWPVPTPGVSGGRLFAQGGFFTPSGRGRFIPVTSRPPVHPPGGEYPLVLNTGRIRDQWHTMTRTGRAPKLWGHRPEPFVELHPVDAARAGVADGALAEVYSPRGRVVVRAVVTATQRPGMAFVPMHWCGPHTPWGRVAALVAPVTDPVSGQPESKHTPAGVRPYTPAWYGFILSRRPLPATVTASCGYYSLAPVSGGWRLELAGEIPGEPAVIFQELISLEVDPDIVEYSEEATGQRRLAGIVADRLAFCAFVGPSAVLPPRDWLVSRLDQPVEPAVRGVLLGGRAPRGDDGGPVVCTCFGVGVHTLTAAIADHGLTTPEALGRRLKAGTNCGSCVPELRALIQRVRAGGESAATPRRRGADERV
ncbi:MAG: molybdopterin-dependent oxidoreductase [Candidatus Competibacterales bacterium]